MAKVTLYDLRVRSAQDEADCSREIATLLGQEDKGLIELLRDLPTLSQTDQADRVCDILAQHVNGTVAWVYGRDEIWRIAFRGGQWIASVTLEDTAGQEVWSWGSPTNNQIA